MNAAEIVQVDSLDIMTTTSAATTDKHCGGALPELEHEQLEKQEPRNKSCVLKEMSVLKGENNSKETEEEELDMSECIAEKIKEHNDFLKQTIRAAGQNDHEVRQNFFTTYVFILKIHWVKYNANLL